MIHELTAGDVVCHVDAYETRTYDGRLLPPPALFLRIPEGEHPERLVPMAFPVLKALSPERYAAIIDLLSAWRVQRAYDHAAERERHRSA